MIPIRYLLNRIRWDKEFGTGTFLIGYLDHVKQSVVRVPFSEVLFEEGNHFSFQVEDESGEMAVIPFHRVREVYRDGILIWSRTG